MALKSAAVIFLGVLGLFVTSVKADVDPSWMKSTLQNHFSQPRHHVTNPTYKKQAMGFIRDEFRSYGLETHIDIFSTRLAEVKGVNVIGVLKGKYFNTDQDRIVGIGAHYDTMRNTSGVDDNGAAVVAMLQSAKNIAAQAQRNYTVIFAAFDFEEWEDVNTVSRVACGKLSCGSQSMAPWMSNFWAIEPQVQGIIIMDTIMNFDQSQNSQELPVPSWTFGLLFPNASRMLRNDGFKGNFLAAIGRMFDSKLLDTFVSVYTAQHEPQFEIERLKIAALTQPTISQMDFNRYQNFMRSDHSTFWRMGFPAIFLTDSANFRGYMKACYHHPCDTMDKVTDDMINFVAKTARALIGTVNRMAPPIQGTNLETPVPLIPVG